MSQYLLCPHEPVTQQQFVSTWTQLKFSHGLVVLSVIRSGVPALVGEGFAALVGVGAHDGPVRPKDDIGLRSGERAGQRITLTFCWSKSQQRCVPCADGHYFAAIPLS